MGRQVDSIGDPRVARMLGSGFLCWAPKQPRNYSVNWNEMSRKESSCRERVELRDQWDLHPEWGYLAPSPSFIRTARAVVLATVVGVIAGGSLIAWISHSGTETSVAARTLVNAPVEPSPARSTGPDHVVRAIIPQSALASVEGPLANETADGIERRFGHKSSRSGYPEVLFRGKASHYCAAPPRALYAG